MYSSWLHKKNASKLIVFCNGWGMDGSAFAHLDSHHFDVLMLYDYTNLPDSYDVKDFSRSYSQVSLVSWSIGVWAGQKLFSSQEEIFHRTIAVNGTLCPMHDELGIPEEIFEGTLLNYDEAGRKKFYHRMCRDKRIYKYFLQNQPKRAIDNQLGELAALKKMIDCTPAENSIYQQVLVTDHDLVVPTSNQLQYWQGTRTTITLLPGVHFPFTSWKSWDEFLGYTNSVYLTPINGK